MPDCSGEDAFHGRGIFGKVLMRAINFTDIL